MHVATAFVVMIVYILKLRREIEREISFSRK